MEARAYLKYLRISPRKVVILCDLIRGKDVKTATAYLMQTPKAASEPMLKLLKSAVANAENNHGMNADNLVVTTAIANQTQQIMQNDNANYRQLHDEIVANRMADKDETIAQLRTQVSQMTLAASQQAQNNYLVNQLRPAPGPAYIVQNPYAGTGTLGCQIAGLTGCCNMAA